MSTTIPCLNCQGAGCDFCSQQGYHTLNKSRRHRAAQIQDAPAMTTTATTDQELIAWAEQQTWSNFALDVSGKARRFGLTGRQREALTRMKAKVDAKPAPQRRAAVPGFQGVRAVLDHIDASGNKFPMLRLSTDDGRALRIRRNRSGRSVGHDAIKLDDLWLGNIDDSGSWAPSAVARDLDKTVKADVWAILTDLRDDAIGTLEKHGKRLSRCSCCGRALSNDESVEFGIGPECRAKLTGLY